MPTPNLGREHATVLAKDHHIEPWALPSQLRTSASSAPVTLAAHERQLLSQTLEECGWNKKETAHRLGISRSSLYDKIKKYQLG